MATAGKKDVVYICLHRPRLIRVTQCSCLFSVPHTYFFIDRHISKVIVTTITPFLLLSTVLLFASINDTMLIACLKTCNNADRFI